MGKQVSKPSAALAGLTGGILNGLFGSGGGSAAVPLLEHAGAEPKTAHALSVTLMFFISIVSAVGCMILGRFPAETVKELLPGGIAGAVTGALVLRKANNDILRRIFGALLILSGGRAFLP
ncbi:MAG: sulfite exporter TauE/SafE family protein [Ruminiclostridium sp.]|nr:sulfite exporter TauE/SafE family protein [Ruminiclostridium sp.]